LITDVCNKHNINIIGLHAHSGSGIKNPDNWCELFKKLLSIKKNFTNVQFIDIGGGLAVTDVMDQNPLDLKLLDKQLSNIKSNHNIKLFAEPGRYLVANAGILLARVTQLKEKGNINYLGIATGMNSLIRPALYGAYHQIVNLSKIDHSSDVLYSIVGPICETGDRIGRDRWMPKAEEGDIILIANAGAYGKVMSSNYNLRGSAEEVLI
jgi:diaminopimelate decarboxylase/aspartate kinase